MSRVRYLAFAGVCLAGIVIAVGALLVGTRQAEEQRQPTAASVADTALDVARVRSGPHIAFRSTAEGPTYGALAVVPLDHPDGPRAVVPGMRCARVYANQAEGVCLTENFDVVANYRAVLLGPGLEPAREMSLTGVPSRTRLSPDGGVAAVTTFVNGHSYTDQGFSTATTVYDVRTGQALGNLEEFRVVVDGGPYRAADLNMWGVTFADRNRFYATVASQGHTWLAEGDLARRELRAVRDQVECPSLSPDGTRIAYKKRNEGSVVTWRVHVLDLRTGADNATAEVRDVDDQVEWLDDHRLLYSLARPTGDETDVWVVAADGTGVAQVLIPRAWSPAVVR